MNEDNRHIDVWEDCLHILEQIVDPEPFATWFKPVRPVSFVGTVLTLEVPSHFFHEYLESAFINELKVALKKVIGPEAKLFYQTRPVTNQPAMVTKAQIIEAPENKPVQMSAYATTSNINPFVYPGIKPLTIDPRLNPAYSFSNLVEGECNKLGISAAKTISDAPGKTPFNPLFIFGGPGLGKTHIAQSIGLSIHEKFPELIVLYVTGNEFKTQFMDAVNVHNKLTDFLAYYMRIDVLIMDDVQGLMGVGCQNAFFNVFNHLHQNGKQLIFTSDRPANELQNFEERMLSRFKWGLSVPLGRPDYETRLKVLRQRAERDGMHLDDDVLSYLATNVKSNFRELEGAIVTVMAYLAVSPGKNPLEIAKEVTDKLVSDNSSDLTIEKVQRTVCSYFNISAEQMSSPSRKRHIVQARQITMYLCRNLIPNCSLSSIGMEIGKKDHATVLHSCNTVSDLMSTDKVFKKYVCDIERILSPEL